MGAKSRVIVITGGIGSGKSVVSRMLEERGISVYDCDSRAKALYVSHPELRALLKDDIFSDAQALANLEKALFPVLLEDFRSWAREQRGPFVGMESATILSKPFFNGFGDYVLYVDAPPELRLARAVGRGNITEASVRERMALQGDCSADRRITHRMNNDSDLYGLEKQIDEFLKHIDYDNGKA